MTLNKDGTPRKLRKNYKTKADHAKIVELFNGGMSTRIICQTLGVGHGLVSYAIRKSKGKHG